MAWDSVTFYWKTMLGTTGTLTASSTASGFAAANIYNMLEINSWKAANTTSPVTLTLDLGAGNSADADYLAVCGHNLNTVAATIVLQHSTTGAWAGEEVAAFTAFAPSSDKAFIQEFTAPGAKRYWQLRITGTFSAAPQIAIAVWGLKTVLGFVNALFDPHEEELKTNVVKGPKGHVLGVHNHYRERRMMLNFAKGNSTLYGKVADWWDNNGMKNFFVAWDKGNNPTDVFLMLPDARRSNPFTPGGLYRNITINLTGRRE